MSQPEHKSEPTIGLASDIPKTAPDFDEYGYTDVARLIAESVIKSSSPQGLVMAVHGAWGMGKTTLMNFVKHYLKLNGTTSIPQILDFNPWWFDDRTQLASQFLGKFSSSLKLDPSAVRKLGSLMAEYSDSLGKAVALSTGQAWIDVPVSALLKLFKIKPRDVATLKSEIAAALAAGSTRYVFFIDDIDRLTPEEIREVFKVVKALADFPNVVYLLSFDRQVVAKALGSTPGLDGEAYLEKIVQVQFSLPHVSKDRLRRKLFSDLEVVAAGADEALFDATYWGNIYYEGIAPLVTKPRDIVRFVNVVATTFPVIRNEVSIADFFALEFIRLQLPDLYKTIAAHPKYFAGRAEHGMSSDSRREEREFHQTWANALPADIKDGVWSMLERIFPRLDNMGRGSEFLAIWRRERRAAAPEIFPIYFSFGMVPDQLSRQAIVGFVADLTDVDKTSITLMEATRIRRPNGTTAGLEYLSHMLDLDDEIDAARADGLLLSLFRVADFLLQKSPPEESGATIPTTWHLAWVMQHALARIDTTERNPKLLDAAENGQGIAFLVTSVVWIEEAHKKPSTYGPATVLSSISADTVTHLKALALNRIRQAAANNDLLTATNLTLILYRWAEWSAYAEPKQWLAGLLSTPLNFITVLSSFLSHSHVSTWGDSVGRIHHSINLKNLADFSNLAEVASLVAHMENEGQLTPRQRLALQVFRSQYPLFKEGKDPDSPIEIMRLS